MVARPASPHAYHRAVDADPVDDVREDPGPVARPASVHIARTPSNEAPLDINPEGAWWDHPSIV